MTHPYDDALAKLDIVGDEHTRHAAAQQLALEDEVGTKHPLQMIAKV